MEYNETFIETSLGKTYVLEAGSRDNKPLALLHGSVSNSAMWFGDIPRFAEEYHVISIDIIGEAGKSEPVRYSFKTDDYSLWLDEVFTCLGLGKAALIGNSYGGWLALKYAVKFPEKVSDLVLIAPSGITGPKLSFLLKSIESISKDEKGMIAFLEYVYGTKKIPDEAAEYTRIMMDGFNPMTKGLPVFSDMQLRRLKMPVMFIAGENDVTMNAAKAASRLKRLVTHSNVMLEKDCGHAIYDEADKILKFLNRKK